MQFTLKAKGQDEDQGYTYRLQCQGQPGSAGIVVNGQIQVFNKAATIPQLETLGATLTLTQLAAILEPAS